MKNKSYHQRGVDVLGSAFSMETLDTVYGDEGKPDRAFNAVPANFSPFDPNKPGLDTIKYWSNLLISRGYRNTDGTAYGGIEDVLQNNGIYPDSASSDGYKPYYRIIANVQQGTMIGLSPLNYLMTPQNLLPPHVSVQPLLPLQSFQPSYNQYDGYDDTDNDPFDDSDSAYDEEGLSYTME